MGRALLLRARRQEFNLSHVALGHMIQLRDATGETIGLTIRIGEQIMHIEQMESVDELRATLEVGRRLPLWSGAPSRIFLAEESDNQIQHILTRRTAADVTPIDPPDLETELAAIRTTRETGYALAIEETTKGVNTLSAAVRDAADDLVATLSITAPSRRMPLSAAETLAPHLIDAAQRLSNKLGWKPRV